MANSIAAPLERRIGEIGGVSDMFSTSSVGNANVIVLFNLDRGTDDAARSVQSALNAAQTDLPSGLPVRPTYKKFQPGGPRDHDDRALLGPAQCGPDL